MIIQKKMVRVTMTQLSLTAWESRSDVMNRLSKYKST